jgi:hypothetical protein
VAVDPTTGKPFDYKREKPAVLADRIRASGKPPEFKIDPTRARLMGRIPPGAPPHSSSYVVYDLHLEKAR